VHDELEDLEEKVQSYQQFQMGRRGANPKQWIN